MALPVARTPDEAHLYMNLHPCARCGTVHADWQAALTSDGGEPARRYFATCPTCGELREFVFRLPERPALPLPDETVLFGRSDRSQLIDAGEWLEVAELCARQAGTAPAGGELDDEARQSLAVAAAAMDEVLKFVPDGAESVPDSAFWSRRGREVRDREPGRFRRRRLQLVRDTYQDVLARSRG
jgi:hypothetical protein